EITWITARKNVVLLQDLMKGLRCFSWEDRDSALDGHYDLAINLEDTLEVARYLEKARWNQLFGAYVDTTSALRYTDDSRRWFDLSLISAYGKQQADKLKLHNRHTYQELIFDGLGLKFQGEKYFLPRPLETGLSGDVAIAAEAGPVWPMKNWAYYDVLK